MKQIMDHQELKIQKDLINSQEPIESEVEI